MKETFGSWRHWRIRVLRRFDLRPDQADTPDIDETIRSGVEFRGTNLWVLIFAIFVASVGLNVNSTAVIIGAMLISPLMGPIMALGYGAGINDSSLMRSALFNLGVATVISLLTSTLYFLVTPLSNAHSELLARTTPTIWDVLIAFFGGLAGVIGITRRVKSNLIPGVAIATALMPPLCTAGYGLAIGNWQYFLGAVYLFTINAVFIAIATLMMVRVMHLPSVKTTNGRQRARRRALVGLVVLATLIPSVFLAVDLVRQEVFANNVNRYVAAVIQPQPNVLLISKEMDHRGLRVALNLAGQRLPDETVEALVARAPEFGLSGVSMSLNQAAQSPGDVQTAQRSIIQELLQGNRAELQGKDERIAKLQAEIRSLQEGQSPQRLIQAMRGELSAQFPTATLIQVTAGEMVRPAKSERAAQAAPQPVLWISLNVPEALTAAEVERLHRGLAAKAAALGQRNLVLDVLSCVERPRRAPACQRLQRDASQPSA
jgi:uncharacterized hydrophobic protein (TIGR00271 family)